MIVVELGPTMCGVYDARMQGKMIIMKADTLRRITRLWQTYNDANEVVSVRVQTVAGAEIVIIKPTVRLAGDKIFYIGREDTQT